MDVHSAKVGFGIRKGLTFLKPGTIKKIRLKIYNCNEIKELVSKKSLEDPHNFLKNCKISTVQSQSPAVNEVTLKMVEINPNEKEIELLSYDNDLWSVNTQRELLASCPDLNKMNKHIKERYEWSNTGISVMRKRGLVFPDAPDLKKNENYYKPQPLPG